MIPLLLLLISSLCFSLSLEDAINIALRNHIESVKSELDLRKIEEEIREVRGSILPSVVLSASYTRWDRNYISSFTPENKYSATLSLNQTIFDRAVFYSLKLSKRSRELQEAVIRDIKRTLATEVEKLFWGVLLSREVMKEKEESLEYWKSFFELVKEKYERGIVPKYEFLRARAELRRARASLINARSEYRSALRSLQSFLGIKGEIELEGKLVKGELEVKDIYESFERNNTTLNLLAKSAEVKKIAVEVSKSGYYPKLNFFFNYNWANIMDFERGGFKEKFKHGYNFGLSLNFTIFDGFKRSAKIMKDKLELEKVQKEILYRRIELRNRLEDLVERLKGAEEEIEARRDTLLAAEESLRFATERYRYGVSSQIELLDARKNYETARIEYLRAIYSYNILLADLKRLILP